MAKLSVISYANYHDKRSWGDPYDKIHPDTPPHKLPKVTGTSVSTQYKHRKWFCRQYFQRRGYHIQHTVANSVLFELRIGKNGGLLDSKGKLWVPANSNSSYSNNCIDFRWEARRDRWDKESFVIDGTKNKTVADLFEAAISKANQSIKPYDIQYDKRMKLLSFRTWLYKYTKGKVDYRRDTWKIASSFSNIKLTNAHTNMSMDRTTLTTLAYPFLLVDRQAFIDKLQRADKPDTFLGTCYNVAYAKFKHTFQLRRLTNFFCWNKRKHVYGWARHLAVEPYAPTLPSGSSQQFVRSKPVYVGRYDNHARVMVDTYGRDNLYGSLLVLRIGDKIFLYRDLSYPSRTFPYMDGVDVAFTDEDREWNIPDVFDHRTWDPYEINNWIDGDLIKSIRDRNAKHVRNKLKHLLEVDPNYIEHNHVPSNN